MNTFVDSNKRRIIQLCVVLWCQRLGFAGTVQTTASNVKITSGDTLELKWTVRAATGENIHSLDVAVLPNTTLKILSALTPAILPHAITLFGVDRLSATFVGSTYTLMLKNVSYADSVTFQLQVIFIIGTKADIKTSEIQVTVNGRPSVCGRNLESKYTVNENRTLSLVQVICGHPKPEVKWKVGDNTFSTSYNSSEINTKIRKYGYSFVTRPFTRKDCGRNLTLVTSNTIGSMERNAKIDVKFVPSLVSKVSSYRHNASCVRVIWHGEDTGKCVINYHLQFGGRETIYNTSNTYFTLCNATDVEKVIIWASYNGNVENKSNSGISITTSSTDITPTSNIATTNEGKCKLNSDCQSTSNVIITVFVTLVITLISISIILVISKHKGYITVSINRKRPPQSYENRSTDDYEEAGATVSHYADIDTKAVKPSIYADLTTTSDQQYAEIELHKKNP